MPTTTSLRGSRLRTRRTRRNGARGALLVEALVVIVFFILAFTSLLFFHAMYGKALHTMRLARAATLGYAMVGCKGDKTAGLSRELTAESTLTGGVSTGNVPYKGGAGGGASSPEVQRALGNTSGVQSGVGNDIARFGVSGSVTQAGAAQLFSSDVTSYSYGACADEVKDETFGGSSNSAAHAIQF